MPRNSREKAQKTQKEFPHPGPLPKGEGRGEGILFAPFRGYFRVPTALPKDSINQGYDDSQSRINETAKSSQIQPNPAKSSQIVPMNIVFEIKCPARPEKPKPFLSENRARQNRPELTRPPGLENRTQSESIGLNRTESD
jgi:hypothetical protein